jgi:dipeptidase E
MKLYLLGGENLVKKNAKKVNAQAFLDAGGAPRVLVFPWARASFDKSYKRREIVSGYFISLGANIVEFVDYSAEAEEIARRIDQSDLIYFTGGVASVLVERLKTKGVDHILRQYEGVVVGRSAGALALCKNCVITDRKKKEMTLIKGLGLVDFTVKAHHKPSKDRELRKLSNGGAIFAIPSGAAIVYSSNCLSFIGEVSLFRNGEKIVLSEPFSLPA